MLSVKARSALREIKAKIAEGKWIKHRAGDGRGNYCLSGHVAATGAPSEVKNEIFAALNRRLARTRYGSVVRFNDAPDVQRQDVINLLDETMAEEA